MTPAIEGDDFVQDRHADLDPNADEAYPDDQWPLGIRRSASAADAAPRNMKCARCLRTLVDEDDVGWYYQTPVTDPEIPGLTFMDRVHECDGMPHDVVAREDKPQDG
jgi:hypothetical protein